MLSPQEDRNLPSSSSGGESQSHLFLMRSSLSRLLARSHNHAQIEKLLKQGMTQRGANDRGSWGTISPQKGSNL